MKIKRLYITALAFIAFALLLLAWGRVNEKTITQITGINLDRCKSINNESSNFKLNTKEFKKAFKNKKLKKVKTSLGNTSHETLKCYDKNNKVLFTFIIIGNRGLFVINKGDSNSTNINSLYQLPSGNYDDIDWDKM